MALLTKLTIHLGGDPVEVHFVTGRSEEAIPHVVAMMKGVHPKYAGLGGVNDGNLSANTTHFKKSGVYVRVDRHGKEEFWFQKLKKIIVVDNEDQMSVLREQGNKYCRNHKLCRTPSIEADVVVALERAGLPTNAFANVNSYGANVEVVPQPLSWPSCMATIFSL
jgi:hypothetical protein